MQTTRHKSRRKASYKEVMKLHPIIYTNEAARSVAGSLEKNIAAKLVSDDTVVLFSTTRMDKILSTGLKSSLYSINFEVWRKQMIKKLSDSAIVAAVSFYEISPNLYAVGTSAGVSGFGPLAYQLIMQEIKPTNSWLKSDASVSETAHKVWNKMYQLPDLYERKWLGDFHSSYIRSALRTHGIRNYDPSVHGETEAEVAIFLGASPDLELTPENIFEVYGNLYAYRLKNDIADYKALYDRGETFFSDLGKYNISEYDIKEIIDRSSLRFFSRRYK